MFFSDHGKPQDERLDDSQDESYKSERRYPKVFFNESQALIGMGSDKAGNFTAGQRKITEQNREKIEEVGRIKRQSVLGPAGALVKTVF